jgi:hypothetical protein
MQVVAGAGGCVPPQGDESLIAVVESQLDRHGIVVSIGGVHIVERRGVDMGPLGKPASVGVEVAHLVDRPLGKVLVVVPLFDPVDGDVAASVEGHCDRALRRPPQVLELSRGHPPAPGEQPRPDQAAAVIVVPLVPAVVSLLEPRVRLHPGEEHAPHLHRVVAYPTDLEWVVHAGPPICYAVYAVPSACGLAPSGRNATGQQTVPGKGQRSRPVPDRLPAIARRSMT